MKRPRDEMPPRLLEGDGEVAELLRKVERQARQVPPETAAWERTLRRLGRDSGGARLRVGMAATVGALVGAMALYVALARTAHLRPTAATTGRAPAAEGEPSTAVGTAAATTGAPSLSPAAPTSPVAAGTRADAASPGRAPAAEGFLAADIPHIHLGRAAVGLPAGHTELLAEADVMLSRGGTARAFATAAAATVELDGGEVELHVEKRPPEARHAFEVTAGGYRFTALGTTFRVARANGDVTLSVTEGRVAVSLGTERLTVVTAGGFWAGAARDPRARRSAPVTMTGSPHRAESPAGTGRTGAFPRSEGEGTSAAGASSPPPGGLAATGVASRSVVASSLPSSSAASSPTRAAVLPRPSQPTFEPSLAPRGTAPANTTPGPVRSGGGASTSTVPPALSSSIAPARATAATERAPSMAVSRCAAGAIAGAPQVVSATKAQIGCLLSAGRGSDLGAEVALYEAARLYRDALGDTGHAIATLRELRRRFPSGALAAEADLSLAELLPAVGRYREALAATAAVLGAQPAPERMAELHLLRGDLLRTGLGDCRSAAAEYAQAAELGPETTGDPASFFAAVCLQRLGDAANARRALERYLTRPHPRHAAEAVQRLRELDRSGHPGG